MRLWTAVFLSILMLTLTFIGTQASASAQTEQGTPCVAWITSDQGISHRVPARCGVPGYTYPYVDMSDAAWAMPPGQYWNNARRDRPMYSDEYAQCGHAGCYAAYSGL